MTEQTVPYVATIVLVHDPYEGRGYDLVDREFFLKYPEPVLAEATWMDGTKLKERYYVVSLKEFMRVVPEAVNDSSVNWTDPVLFPIDFCNRSFKPNYIK